MRVGENSGGAGAGSGWGRGEAGLAFGRERVTLAACSPCLRCVMKFWRLLEKCLGSGGEPSGLRASSQLNMLLCKIAVN